MFYTDNIRASITNCMSSTLYFFLLEHSIFGHQNETCLALNRLVNLLPGWFYQDNRWSLIDTVWAVQEEEICIQGPGPGLPQSD